MPLVRHVWGLLVLLALGSAAHAAPYSYATHQLQLTDLGAGVNPTAINNVGQVVGQAANSQAFLWAGGVTTPLGTVGGSQSYANDLNGSGVVVGWSLDGAAKQKPFMWDSVNSMVNLETSATIQGAAEAINSSGVIVGWRTNGTVTKSAAGGQGSAWHSVFTSETVNNKSLGINDQGYIVGITLDSSSNNLVDSFYYDGFGSGGNFTHLMAPGYSPQAGVNNSLMTAGTTANLASYLAIGSSSPLSLAKLSPSDDFAAFYGLNDLNQLVGTSGEKGLLYDIPSNGVFDLNLFPRQTLGFGQVLRLTDINNNGTFVGVALVGGVEHGFVGQLVPVPEPSSFVTLALGLAALVVWIGRVNLIRILVPRSAIVRRLL